MGQWHHAGKQGYGKSITIGEQHHFYSYSFDETKNSIVPGRDPGERRRTRPHQLGLSQNLRQDFRFLIKCGADGSRSGGVFGIEKPEPRPQPRSDRYCVAGVYPLGPKLIAKPGGPTFR